MIFFGFTLIICYLCFQEKSNKSMITRVLEESIRNKLGQDKAIVIMGARQVR